MKKVFFSVVLLFAFSTISFAQDNKIDKKTEDPYVLAKAELNELIKEITLENSLENGLFSLLIYKHETLAKATTEKEKNDVYATMKSKIEGSLTPEQLKKLKSNKVLFENLIK